MNAPHAFVAGAITGVLIKAFGAGAVQAVTDEAGDYTGELIVEYLDGRLWSVKIERLP